MSTHNTTGNDIHLGELRSPVSPIESTFWGSEGSNAGLPPSDHTQVTGPHREERDPHSELFSRASRAWLTINALNHKESARLKLRQSFGRFDFKTAHELAMTSDEVKSAFLAQCRPDISTLVLTAAVVTYWSVVAGISPENDEKSKWGLYAGASAAVAFVLKDGAVMVSRSGAKSALESLWKVAATYSPDSTQWSDHQQQLWRVENSVAYLEGVASVLESKADEQV